MGQRRQESTSVFMVWLGEEKGVSPWGEHARQLNLCFDFAPKAANRRERQGCASFCTHRAPTGHGRPGGAAAPAAHGCPRHRDGVPCIPPPLQSPLQSSRNCRRWLQVGATKEVIPVQKLRLGICQMLSPPPPLHHSASSEAPAKPGENRERRERALPCSQMDAKSVLTSNKLGLAPAADFGSSGPHGTGKAEPGSGKAPASSWAASCPAALPLPPCLHCPGPGAARSRALPAAESHRPQPRVTLCPPAPGWGSCCHKPSLSLGISPTSTLRGSRAGQAEARGNLWR